ncbi:MAG: hypothetical protein ABWX94_01885 [Candidatus Saccharimonadales bacterium]
MEKRKFYLQLTLQSMVGLLLAWLTRQVFISSNTIDGDQAGWLSLVNPTAGVAYFGLMLLLLGLDIFWITFLILWLMRRKLHMKAKDKTLYLP